MAKQTQQTQLEQGRAAYAYDCAEHAANSLNKPKEYKAYVKKMPALIKTNGLGATMAFAFSKGARGGKVNPKDPWGLLYTQIEDWLLHKDVKQLVTFEKGRIAQFLTTTKSCTYRLVTVEVLALLNWLRRFADALIEGDSTGNDGD